MRKARLILLLILPYCLIELSCGHSLTRSVAAQLINKRLGYPKPDAKAIRVGDDSLGWEGESPDLFHAMGGVELGKYKDAGLINITELKYSTERRGGRMLTTANFTVELTGEGRRYLISQEKSRATVRRCSWVLVEVTGIAFFEDKSRARAEFTSRCSDITPFGVADGIDESQLQSGSIDMQLYDDGWRA